MREFVLVLLASVLAASAFGQAVVGDGNKVAITIKGSSVKNGEVLVEGIHGRKHFELECQLGRADCATLEAGEYWMVRLVPHAGIYMDCENADVYAKSPDGKNDRKLGEYCLLQDPRDE
jgi:hypothetical protein